jgi:hypothetical protein
MEESMKVIGKYSVAKEDIVVTIPKIRKVGNKLYPYKSKYLGGGEDGYILTRSDVEKDIYAVLKIKVKLVSKNSRGGDIVEV